MANKKKWLLFGCLGLTGLVLVAAAGFALIFFITAGMSKVSEMTADAEKEVANNILNSMQSAAELYAEKQGIAPDKFSDYITFKKDLSGTQYTLSFNEVTEYTAKPRTWEDLNGKSFDLVFYTGSKVKYYLDGTDVTMEFK